jgi:mannose/fructose/N-acetylgalactosamine-specific phosphotransferase system component IIC
VLALLLWATIAGLDLASVLQGLFNRPLLAGAVAGVIIGDPETGLRTGAALELFALDVLPIGASRYADYGAATVAAVVLGSGQWWEASLGESVLLGLVLAYGGGWTVVLHRRLTMAVLRRAAPALDRGDPGVAVRVHLAGLLSDLVRSAALAGFGMTTAILLRSAPPLDFVTGRALTVVAVAGGFVAVIGGALRRAGTPRRMTWLAVGIGLGAVGLSLR